MSLRTPDTIEEQDAAHDQSQDYYNDKFNRPTNDLSAQENRAGSSYADDTLDDHSVSGGDASGKSGDVKDKEKAAGNWKNKVSGNRPQQTTFFSRLKNNKKRLGIIGVGGGGLAALALTLFLAIMPLKLEMFIQNMTKAAASVPAYAVEQRTEYLITRALATRLMMMSNGATPQAGQIAFCGNRSISCSLFLTYTSNYFEDKMDFNFQERTNGNVFVTVKGKGRSSLGAKAHGWEIEVSRDMGDGGVLKTIKSIEFNSDMKAYIKTRVRNDMQTSNTITRFLARRILMKKYGVSHWRGFEKTQKKAADIKSSVKASIFKNTVGKVAPRTAMYMACLSGGDGCAKLLESYKNNIDLEKIKAEHEDGENSREYRAAVKQQATIDKIQASLSGATPEGGDSVMSKFISKKILASASAGIGVVVLADLAFIGISQIDKGALEEIGYDMMKTATIGYAFGDEAGIVVNNDKMKAGDIDLETLGTLTSMFEDSEKSALWAAENGIASAPGTVSAASDQITRECDTAGGLKPVALDPGQTVCPERRLVRDYSSSFTQNGLWGTLSAMADIWIASPAHLAVETFGEISAAAFNNIPGMRDLMSGLNDLLKPTMDWLVSLIVDVPTMGFETTGANNYDALSAGIRVSQNELMQQGVGTDGKAFGGGGTVLSNDQIAMIQQQSRSDDQEYYDQQPVLAKIFNTSLRGSFAQHLVAALPTNAGGLLQAPSLALASLTTPRSTLAATPLSTNPFNMPIYGYASNDPLLTADPSTYDDATCATLAKAREDSFDKHPGSLVATYSVSDPCALERMVVGAALEDAGVTDDPNSMPTLASLNTTQGGETASTGDGQSTGEFLWPLKAPDSAQNISRCYIPGTYKSGHLAIDIGTFASSLEVVAVDGGEVVWTHQVEDRAYESFGNAITIKHKDGLFTTYSHNAKLLVKKGDKVTKGQKIADSGSTGNSESPHLHFEVSKQASPYWPDTTNTMDPLNYFTIPAGIPIPSGLGCRR